MKRLERKRDVSNWNLCLWEFSKDLWAVSIQNFGSQPDGDRGVYIFTMSLNVKQSFVNSFYRDSRDVQRPLSMVQPVCWLGPPLQSRYGRQNRHRARTSQRIVLPQRHGDLKWAPLLVGTAEYSCHRDQRRIWSATRWKSTWDRAENYYSMISNCRKSTDTV